MTRRDLRLATTAYVLAITVQTTFIFYLAPVALARAGLAGEGAWVFVAAAVATAAAVVPAGRLSDRHPRRAILRVGMTTFVVAQLVFSLAPDRLAVIVAASALNGIGLAFTIIPFNSYVADLMSAEHMTRAYGRSGALSVLASAAGPVVAAWALTAAGGDMQALRTTIALTAAVAVASVLFTIPLPSTRTHTTPPAFNPNPPERSALKPMMVLNVLVGVGIGLSSPYFAIYFLETVRVTEAAWGLLLAGATAAGAFGFWFVGILARHFTSRTLIVGGQSLHLLVTLAFVAPFGWIVLSMAYMGRTLLSNAIAPLTNTIIMSRAAAGVRGQAQGWTNLAWNVGWATGALVGGPLLAVMGGALFPLGAGFAVVGALSGFAVLERRLLIRPTRPRASW